MSAARDLARFLLGVRYEDLPPLAIKHAKMVIASTFASAAVGTQIESARIIQALAKERGGTPDASVWFDEARLPVADVARVNAMLSDAAASDDSDLRSIAHIGTICTATALAMAERTGASGRDLLSAIVCGYEASGRINDCITPGERGFHATTITIFAGAVVAGRLLGLDEGQLAHAIALCATSTGGLGISTNSLAREYHAGNSALLSINAALAAQRGYTADEGLLEARRGFIEVFAGKQGAEPLTRDLGVEWDIVTHLAIKLYPGAHPFHAVTEAAVNASRQANVAPEEIEAILVASQRAGGNMIGSAHPTDLASTIHSLPYYMAAAVADRDFGWEHVSEAKVFDPTIGSLLERVQADPDPPPAGAFRWGWGGRVTIVCKDGRRFAASIDEPRGSGPRGIDWADVETKYRHLLPDSGLANDRIESALAQIHDIESAGGVSELLQTLRL